MLEIDIVNTQKSVKRALVCFLTSIIALCSVACSNLKQEQIQPTENGYWRHKPYQTTVRLYNGDRMPVTRYKKVWVDVPVDVE